MVFLLAVTALLPTQAFALSFVQNFTERVKFIFLPTQAEESIPQGTSQTVQLLKPTVLSDDTSPDLSVATDSEALQATTGALRISTEDINFPTNDTISVYEVKKGDTLTTIAKLFGVSKNTIMWANDLKTEKVSPGDTLVILPITGIKHTVKKGDTLTTIAKKYKADVQDVSQYNGIAKDAELSVGTVVIVPDGEIAQVEPKKVVKKTGSSVTEVWQNSSPQGFLARPLFGGRKTQGIHGHNGVDIAATPGTPVLASASGRVIIARSSGYNGGYGNMVIIVHEGNIQTVYAHLRDVYVSSGETVAQGQSIGTVGNTGRSTGPHLHFEVRGAKNPF